MLRKTRMTAFQLILKGRANYIRHILRLHLK
jgi:hypothetical protein